MTQARDTSSKDPCGDEGTITLVVMALLTVTLLLLAEIALSRNVPIAIAALKVYGVVAALICASLALGRAATPPTAILIVIGALLVASVARTLLLVVPVLVLAGFGAVRVRWALVFAPLRAPAVWIGAASACTLILPVVHLGDFLIIEKVAQGAAHQDTLFHASIAGMIKTYGVASTGLHGLVPLSYHVLSHRLTAGLSFMSGVSVLELYGILEVMVLCPLLLFAAAWAALQISGERAAMAPRLWLIACGILTLMKLLPLENWNVGDPFFVSDSYTLSLTLLLFALPALLAPAVRLRAFALAAALLIAAGLSKGSLGLLGVGLLWITLITEPRDARRRLAVVAALASALLFYGLASASASASSAWVFDPFYSAQVYAVWGADVARAVAALRVGSIPETAVVVRAGMALAVFVAVSFVLCWLVIVRRIRTDGVRAWRRRDVQFICAAILLGLAALQFRMAGGGYFVDQALFVALPVAIATLVPHLHRVPRWGRAALACGVLSGGVWLTVDGYYDRPLGPVFMKDKQFIDRLNDRGRGGPLKALQALRTPRLDGHVIFQADPTFPKHADVWDCFNEPFTYPAVTEHAWVDLLDPETCKYSHYGYPPYFEGTPPRLVPPVVPPGGRVVRVGGP